MGKINFAIIGCGNISRIGHIPNLMEIPGAEIVAVCDVDEENLSIAAEMIPGVDTYQDYEKLLVRDDVEVVVVATPNWLHCEQTVAALEAGKAVFCEKPLGVDLDEVERIRKAQKESGGFLQVGHELRHARVFEVAKEKVTAGVIGEVKMLAYREFRNPLRPGWRQTGKTGGVMLEKNSHFFDLFNWFAAAEPVQVLGIGGNDVNKESPLIDNCFVAVEYENGVKAELTMCLFCENGGSNGMEIIGSKGMMRIHDEVLDIFSRNSTVQETIDCSISPQEGMHMGCRREFEALIECLRNHQLPRNNCESAINTLKLCLAAEAAVTKKDIEK